MIASQQYLKPGTKVRCIYQPSTYFGQTGTVEAKRRGDDSTKIRVRWADRESFQYQRKNIHPV